MKKYDVIVIGSGCGMNIIDEAINHGMSVALVDKGPLGGTCANLGCIRTHIGHLQRRHGSSKGLRFSGKHQLRCDSRMLDIAVPFLALFPLVYTSWSIFSGFYAAVLLTYSHEFSKEFLGTFGLNFLGYQRAFAKRWQGLFRR
jgi:hypothetical protein